MVVVVGGCGGGGGGLIFMKHIGLSWVVFNSGMLQKRCTMHGVTYLHGTSNMDEAHFTSNFIDLASGTCQFQTPPNTFQ